MRVLLVIYDNDSYVSEFPIGTAHISAVLKKEKIDVEIYHQDIHHYPCEHLTDYLNANRFDVIGIGVIAGYYQYKKLLELSKAINNSKNRPLYILGGHGPTPEPEFFLQQTGAEIVVLGEGEQSIINLLKSIANHTPLENVKGIAFRNNETVIINDRESLIKQIDDIPWPDYNSFPIEYYRLIRFPHANSSDFGMSMLSGRGCTFKCNFCYRMDTGLRLRSNDSIIEEIKYLQKEFRISYIAFYDELLMTSIDRTISLCSDFVKARLNIKWLCNGRLNYARKDVLKLMKESGCVFINYGIEAMDDQILKNMNKALTTKQIISGIEATLEAGISPGYNIIFGNIGETIDTLEKGVQFLLKYDDGAQLRTIRPVSPYPGSPLYYYAIQKGYLKNCEDFYHNKHINSDLLSVNFTQITDDEFHEALMHANTRLIKNYYEKQMKLSINTTSSLYLDKNVSFRGFRHT